VFFIQEVFKNDCDNVKNLGYIFILYVKVHGIKVLYSVLQKYYQNIANRKLGLFAALERMYNNLHTILGWIQYCYGKHVYKIIKVLYMLTTMPNKNPLNIFVV